MPSTLRRLCDYATKCLADVLSVTRRGVIAYLAIAFAISWGFHAIERRTDEALRQADRVACQRDRQIQEDTDRRIDAIAQVAGRLTYKNDKDRREAVALIKSLHKQSLPNCDKDTR